MKRGEEGEEGREREETRDTERNESVGGEAAAEREGLEARVETTKSGEAAPVNVAYYKAPSAAIPPVAPPVALPSSTNRPRSSIHATIAPASTNELHPRREWSSTVSRSEPVSGKFGETSRSGRFRKRFLIECEANKYRLPFPSLSRRGHKRMGGKEEVVFVSEPNFISESFLFFSFFSTG